MKISVKFLQVIFFDLPLLFKGPGANTCREMVISKTSILKRQKNGN